MSNESSKVNSFSASLSKICSQFDVRLDAKYRSFWDENNGSLFLRCKAPTLRLRRVLKSRPRVKVRKGTHESVFVLIDLENVESQTGRISECVLTSELGSDRFRLAGWDLFTNRLRPYLRKCFETPKDDNLIGSLEWIPLRVNRDAVAPLLLKSYLLSGQYERVSRKLMSGKNHPRISELDLHQLRIPIPSSDVQSEVTVQVQRLESEIEELRGQLPDEIEIIHNTLQRHLGLDLSRRFHKFGRGVSGILRRMPARTLNSFIHDTITLSQLFPVRLSARFHRPENEDMRAALMESDHVHLKHCVREPIRRGVQPKDREGEIPVIKSAQINDGRVDFEDCEYVTSEFFSKVRHRAGVMNGDVLLTSTGNAIGKAAPFCANQAAIVDSHVAVIRPNALYSGKFLAIVLRSILGAFQVERDYSGINFELSPDAVGEFAIPKIALSRQEEIVEEIYAKQSLRDELLKSILEKRKRIDALISAL